VASCLVPISSPSSRPRHSSLFFACSPSPPNNDLLMAAAAVAPVVPQHPAGFLLNNHHPTTYPEPAPSVQPTAPVAPKPQPSDPYYGHEETARLCGRFIRHVFSCPVETPSTARTSNLTSPKRQTPHFALQYPQIANQQRRRYPYPVS
jgi:hypothetical protein